MASLFGTLNTARRGLEAQQSCLDTISHNIANANTEGYSRQRVVLQATAALPVPSMSKAMGAGQYGTGVEVQSIERVRNSFTDWQIRNQAQKLGALEQQSDFLGQVEVALNETGESGLSTQLRELWNSWQELSYNAESSAVRATVLGKASTFAENLRSIYGQLQTVVDDANQLLSQKVASMAISLQEIADLNQQIVTCQSVKLSPNDLLDRRDQLLDEISKTVAITTEPVQTESGADTGAIKIVLANDSSVVLLDWNTAAFASVINGLGTEEALEGTVVTWNGEALTGNQLGGELSGLLAVREKVSTDYMAGMDAMARALAKAVNDLHQAGRGLDGSTGLSFFVNSEGGAVTGAADFYVNQDLEEDVFKLAAASSGTGEPASGDGSTALAIAQLRNQAIQGSQSEGGLGGFTVSDFYATLVSRVGADVYQAQTMVDNQNVLVDQLTNRRESVSGVSLDEETINLLLCQHAYQAAAQVINVIDDMLDTLINKMAP